MNRAEADRGGTSGGDEPRWSLHFFEYGPAEAGIFEEWRRVLGERVTREDESADLHLFWEPNEAWQRRALRAHPLVRRKASRVFAYAQADLPVPILPGVYPGLGSGGSGGRVRGGFYWLPEEARFAPRPLPEAPRYLVSFMGGSTSWTRKRLFRQAARWPEVYVEDTSAYFHWDGRQEGREAAQRRYADVIAGSPFVLCPRGAGHSSYRVFETMQAGRVPVVVDDGWNAPPDVDWPSCSLRVPERELPRLPDILRERLPEAEAMGAEARRVWRRCFAPEVRVRYLVRVLEELAATAPRLAKERWAAWELRHALRHSARTTGRKVGVALLSKLGLLDRLHLNRPG